MRKTRKEDILSEFLSEFAGHLIGCGITMVEFRRAAQSAFVQAAINTGRLRNFRVNQSAIAAATGLTRSQVRTLLRRSPKSPPDVRTRVSAVVSGWKSDPEFADREGRPLPLSTAPGPKSFPTLIQKYGRDVSHRALLAEMRRMGYVVTRSGSVSLRKAETKAKPPEMTSLLSQGLAHVIRRPSTESAAVLDVITGEATYEWPEGISSVLLRRRLLQSTQAFAADLQVSGEASASRQKAKSTAKRVSTKILLVTVG
jgi:hypothetical protein